MVLDHINGRTLYEVICLWPTLTRAEKIDTDDVGIWKDMNKVRLLLWQSSLSFHPYSLSLALCVQWTRDRNAKR